MTVGGGADGESAVCTVEDGGGWVVYDEDGVLVTGGRLYEQVGGTLLCAVVVVDSCSTNAGFSRSIEIFSGFPFLITTKYLSARSVTR